MSAATLKRAQHARELRRRDVAFPRSRERGHIEARDHASHDSASSSRFRAHVSAATLKHGIDDRVATRRVPRFPRSRERGHIEAVMTVSMAATGYCEFPRSRERGHIEARRRLDAPLALIALVSALT